MPFSAATFFARGEAFIRPPCVTTVVLISGFADAAGEATLAAAGAATDIEAVGFLMAFRRSVISVSCLPMMAITSFTFAALPASTPVYNKVPSA